MRSKRLRERFILYHLTAFIKVSVTTFLISYAEGTISFVKSQKIWKKKILVRKIGITSRYALNKNKKAIYTTFQKRRRKGVISDGSGLECCDKKFKRIYK